MNAVTLKVTLGLSYFCAPDSYKTYDSDFFLSKLKLLFTFRVQLHVDDVSHNRRVVKRLHGHFGGFHALENNFGYPQVLFVLRIVQDLDLLDFSEFFAHFGKKYFPDIVVEPGESHLLWRHRADVTLIDLEEE